MLRETFSEMCSAFSSGAMDEIGEKQIEMWIIILTEYVVRLNSTAHYNNAVNVCDVKCYTRKAIATSSIYIAVFHGFSKPKW